MDYTNLSVTDEITVLRNKLREVEAQHFAHSVDLQTVAALGGNEETEQQIQNALVTLDAQHQFLTNHLAALEAYAQQQAEEPGVEIPTE